MTMPKQRLSVIAAAAVAALVLIVLPTATRADDELAAAQFAYEAKCAAYRWTSEQLRQRNAYLSDRLASYLTSPYSASALAWERRRETFDPLIREANQWEAILPMLSADCDRAHQIYAEALARSVTEMIMAGPEREPKRTRTTRTTTKKPQATTARRSAPSAPSGQVHSVEQTEALAIIGGLILQGATQRDPRRGRRTPQPSGRSGGHHNPQTSGTHYGTR